MVPEGWKPAQIGDLAKFMSGGTPSKQKAEYWGGSEPWVSGKDLKTHYLVDSIDTLSREGFNVAKKAPQGSSLILVRGMTLLKNFPVGYATREVAFNQDVKALIPVSSVDGLFLSFLLVAEKHKIRQLVSTAGHGTGRLDTTLIQEYPVNLPPLSEQKKIAQILFTWDKAITTTEQLFANSQQQKKALMQQLLTGKKRLLDKNGERFSGEWESHHLKKLLQISKGNQLNKDTLSKSGEYAVINGGIEPSGYTSKYNTEANTTTVSEGGNSCGFVGFQSTRFWCGGHCYAIKNLKIDLNFTYQLLKFNQSKIMRLRVGSGLPNIQKKDLEALSVDYPISQEEQQKIAAVLSTADQEITILQQKLDHLKQEKKALMQQLLTGKRRVKTDDMEAA
ncbi:restriction endonuclease subunit S [Oceanospirillum maris]|uniref:restriction endonuclease subunit S n=1 Tax=Oceanospirillum maris TaxID=64977 RepID=UPI0003FD1DAE|nr:restriction endonuclease subunit S [Oceanospirillum maris]